MTEPNHDPPGDLPQPAPPETVGPYRIESKLGAGGMGEVYRARDERLGRAVAIKKVRPREGREEKDRRRLRREARVVAGLDHPAIVRVFDLKETADGDWIVMELVEGRTLKKVLEERIIAEAEAIALAREIIDGLTAAHGQGLVHRDLKAENVMVTAQGHVKILDFGLAQQADQERRPKSGRSQKMVAGTSRTMSPEQAMGLKLDARSDLFSFGVLLYEMVTGESPFLAGSHLETRTRVCRQRQVPVAELRPEISPELSHLIDHLLEKDPRRRPKTAEEASRILGKLAGAAPISPALEHFLEPAPGGLTSEAGTITEAQRASLLRLRNQDKSSAPTTRPATAATVRDRPPKVESLPGGVYVRTLVFAGLAEPVKFLRQLGVTRSSEIFSRHDRSARDLGARFHGLQIDKAESFLFLFKRTIDAVGFALAYQLEVEHLADRLELELRGRVGIHLGEVYLHENSASDVARGAKPLEVEGRTRLAARHLERLAEPGQILASRGVYELTLWARIGEAPDNDLQWIPRGPRKLDGLADELEIYEITAHDFGGGSESNTGFGGGSSSLSRYGAALMAFLRRILKRDNPPAAAPSAGDPHSSSSRTRESS